jgi:hypothetical protein
MNFKIEKGNPLFDQLQALRLRAERAEQKAEAFVVHHFATPHKRANAETDICGGVVAVFRDTKPKPKPKLFRPVIGHPGWYAPFAKHIRAEVAKLPVVSHTDVKDTLGMRGVLGSLAYPSCSPRLIFDASYVLVSIPGDVRRYQPRPEMVEILGSEFNNLADSAVNPID